MSWIDASTTFVHITRGGSEDAVLAHGLRPASYWVERAVGLSADERRRLLEWPRPVGCWLELETGHRVWLRDQQPLLRGRLANVLLPGTTVAEFMRGLNDRVYLYPDAAGAGPLVEKYRRIGDQSVLHLLASTILAAVGERVEFTRFNPGAIGRQAAPYKSLDQFVPAERWTGGRPREIAVVSPGIPADVLRSSLVDIVGYSGATA